MKNCVEGKLYKNRESKSLEIKVYLYRCYDEHASPSSCNTTVYLPRSKGQNCQSS